MVGAGGGWERRKACQQPDFQFEDLSTWTGEGSAGKGCEELKREEEIPFPGMCGCAGSKGLAAFFASLGVQPWD